MSESVAAVVALIFGLGSISMGVMFKRGRLRRMARWYTRDDLPYYMRNLPFALIPGGVAFLLLFLMFALGSVDLYLLAFGCFLASIPFLGLAIYWHIRPPDWLKPAWMRSLDAARGGSC